MWLNKKNQKCANKTKRRGNFFIQNNTHNKQNKHQDHNYNNNDKQTQNKQQRQAQRSHLKREHKTTN